jgi:hypothetical protein
MIWSQKVTAIGLCSLLAPFAMSQSGPTLVGSGYAVPALPVAPGQIVELQVTGLKTVLAQPVSASQVPLPTSLAGIAVTINQYLHGMLATSMAVPLVSIQQTNSCDDGSATADCMLTSITVQIPFEITVVPFSGGPQTELVISENGVKSKGFGVGPRSECRLHSYSHRVR